MNSKIKCQNQGKMIGEAQLHRLLIGRPYNQLIETIKNKQFQQVRRSLSKSFLIKMPNSSFKMAFMKTIFQQIVYLLINKIYFLLIC